MIPKVIHYCWFGGGKKDSLMEHCLQGWKKVMPDYEIKCWDASTLDMSIPYVREAYNTQSWAFLTDYMRVYILWKEGGIYMDLDVEVYRPFDIFLENRMFSGIDYQEDVLFKKENKNLIDDEGGLLAPYIGDASFGIVIEAGILGSEKGHPYMKACADYYRSIPFIDSEGNKFKTECPVVLTGIAVDFGFRYKNSLQHLNEGICIYPYHVFETPGDDIFFPDAYACHWWTGTWRETYELDPMADLLSWLNLELYYKKLYYKREKDPYLFRIYNLGNRIIRYAFRKFKIAGCK